MSGLLLPSSDTASLMAAVDRLAHLPGEFRTLRPSEDRVAAVQQAASRLAAAFTRERGAEQPVLTIAFAGCTGAGKSTLINALAKSRITRVIGRAATTRQAHVYHHQDLKLAGLPKALAQSAVLVPHDRAELATKVLIDTPDLDTAITANRQTTKAILKAATLVLYVFTPDRYAEERVWSVIEQERRFSAFAAVLNKTDRVSPDELERMTADLRGLFTGSGASDVRIFRTQAIRHQPDEQGNPPPPFDDDFASLRAFIEKELQRSDIMRIARRQRLNAMTALRSAIDAIAPADMLDKFATAAKAGECAVDDASGRLTSHWHPVFIAAEDAVLPAAKRRYHERFRGPIRAWFAMWDGAAAIGAKLSGKPADTLDLSSLRTSLDAGSKVVEDRLAAISQSVQDSLHDDGLPVGRWNAIIGSGKTGAQQVSTEVAAAVESACRMQATACTPAREKLARIISWISVAVMALVVIGGAWRFIADLASARYEGPLLLLNLLGLTVFTMLGLHLIVGLAGPGGKGTSIEETGAKTIEGTLTKLLSGRLASYRADLDSDFTHLRGPLAQIEQAVGEQDVSLDDGDQGTPIFSLSDAAGAQELPIAEAILPELTAPALRQVPAEEAAVTEVALPASAAVEPVSTLVGQPRKSLSDYLKEVKR